MIDKQTVEIADMQVAAIILTRNQRAQTLRCLASLETAREKHLSILLWDNGSTDGTAHAVRERFPDVLVREHPTNLGAASGRNTAARLAIERWRPSHLLFLDNDTVVTEGFLAALSAPFMRDAERLAQTSAKILFMTDRNRLCDAGGSEIRFWSASTRPIGHGETDVGQYDYQRECIPPTGCLLVRSDVFEHVGGFDPRFDPYGMEDLDFSLRVRKAGYRSLFVPEAVIYHDDKEPGERRTYTPHYKWLKIRNWCRFVRKHASPRQALAFLLLGIPSMAARNVVRGASRWLPTHARTIRPRPAPPEGGDSST